MNKPMLLSFPRSGRHWMLYCINYLAGEEVYCCHKQDAKKIEKTHNIVTVEHGVSNRVTESKKLILLVRNYKEFIPSVVYTFPELASVGKTEEFLKENQIKYKKGIFHFRANGRALCMDSTDGLVKVLSSESDGKVLGAHIVGPWASELIANFTLLLCFPKFVFFISSLKSFTQTGITCHGMSLTPLNC